MAPYVRNLRQPRYNYRQFPSLRLRRPTYLQLSRAVTHTVEHDPVQFIESQSFGVATLSGPSDTGTEWQAADVDTPMPDI